MERGSVVDEVGLVKGVELNRAKLCRKSIMQRYSEIHAQRRYNQGKISSSTNKEVNERQRKGQTHEEQRKYNNLCKLQPLHLL